MSVLKIVETWKKEETKIWDKKKHVKHVTKSDRLTPFCLTMSSVFCTNKPFTMSALRKPAWVICTNYLVSDSKHVQVLDPW